MNTTNTRKKISAALAVMAVAMLTVGTLAYFTDRATGTANFTVMQADDAIDIVLTPENPDPQPGDPDSGDRQASACGRFPDGAHHGSRGV